MTAKTGLLGLETEYAFTPLGPRGGRVDRTQALLELLELTRTELVCLPDGNGNGFFLENGSRLYIDCGNHPELSTPECSSPHEVVRYTLAGERILAGLAAKLLETTSLSQALLFKSNVDYGGSSTWGCHESYLYRSDPRAMFGHVVPHFVTRPIYSGAGGFVPCSPGLTFTLSPRAFHLNTTVSSSSTENRGIFHTKDEPLCEKGYHRLHVLCGESLCSQTAQLLKLGTTALIVALIEIGASPGTGLALADPLDAMKRIARDPACSVRVPLCDGRSLTAIEIQHAYLEAVEASLEAAAMPPWAEELCGVWRTTLARLAEGPSAVSTTLDWAIKLELYRSHAARRGIAWDELPRWTTEAERVHAAAGRREQAQAAAGRRQRSQAAASRRQRLPRMQRELDLRETRDTADVQDSHGGQAGQRTGAQRDDRLDGDSKHDGLERFVRMRDELFEADVRFGQLGGAGIFDGLERAGVLEHAVPGLGDVEAAMTEPPAQGRAHHRGYRIRELAGEPRRYRVSWQGIHDRQDGRVLDMSDPYVEKLEWRKQPPLPDELMLEQLDRSRGVRGAFRRAHAELRRTRPRT